MKKINATEAEALIRIIAALRKDGECMEHGDEANCPTDGEYSCDLYEMTNDEAWEALHELIAEARRLVA